MENRQSSSLPKRGLDYATHLIHQVCSLAGQVDLIGDVRASFAEAGLIEAVQQHDNDALFAWLAEAISFQGISDSVAAGYIEQHGIVEAMDVRHGLNSKRLCPKLKSYWHFSGCGYRKGSNTCNEPHRLRQCPLPRHDLRNGNLNQAAYGLYLFMRDIAGGDFVSWIDSRLSQANQGIGLRRLRGMRDAVVQPLGHVHGVSDKVLNMSLANLLLGGDPNRGLWVEAGAGMTDLPDRLLTSDEVERMLGVKRGWAAKDRIATARIPHIKIGKCVRYRLSPAAIIEDSESREAYIVAPDIAVGLSNEFNLVELFTAIDRQGGLSIWPVKLPGIDGRQNAWHTSMKAAAEMATKKWVRVAANMSVGAYDVFEATGNLPEPEWPELTFPKILEIAFRGRVIDSFDHPLLKRLRGEV